MLIVSSIGSHRQQAQMTNKTTTHPFDKMSDYVALIGRGQKSGKTLNQVQARHLMGAMLEEKTSPEQTGALLMLLRMREETDEELAGFLQACRDTLPAEISDLPKIDLDLGCYAGKRRHLPWFLLAALVLSTNGFKVLLHGLEERDSNRLYLDSVLNELAWPIASDITQVKTQLDSVGFSYISIEQLHPKMTRLLKMRHTLGLRSCMHSIAKMLNPANAVASVHGVYHRELDTTHMKVAQLLSETQVACIRGDSGEVEATPEKAFDMQYINQSNEVSNLQFPLYAQQWSHQTRQLGVSALKKLWTGEINNAYGEAATISTLAVYLASLEADPHAGKQKDPFSYAKELWHSRDKIWPLHSQV